MTNATESFAASAVKVAAVAGGSAMSGMQSITNALGGYAQALIWLVTITYGIFQIAKCIPWFSDQSLAFWRGVRYGDWSRWWQIARRGEKSNGE